LPALGLALLVAGCASTKINWNARVGEYTFDQAVLDYGPPDKSAKLTDGTQVCDWLTQRGYARGGYFTPIVGFGVHSFYDSPSPDYYLRLTFEPAGKLKAWKKFAQ
jgi:hypothetical protein